LILGSLILIGSLIFISSDFYASFLREHKILRFYANPTKPIESLFKFIKTRLPSETDVHWQSVGLDATRNTTDERRELVILIVGETARAQNFSLNGYPRLTNPLLSEKPVVSFSQFASCGTDTAVSLPCMFSLLERSNYSIGKANSMDNVLDVLKRTGVAVLWRENNTGPKRVADRIEYQDFTSPDVNPVCEQECRDEGMLNSLDAWTEKQANTDMLIILHQMGSHGPAYYKRYPDKFEKFKPACKTIELEKCSAEEITNAYDNTIVYTDYFISEAINWLEQKSGRFDVSLLYVSDHGESLGESGIYLHGFPYRFAPETQTRVPVIFWSAANNSQIDFQAVMKSRDEELSHDHLFHTLLGLFEVSTTVYRPDMDFLRK
jgi:lipid A ethanolaminephosphotransferase